MNKHIFYNVLVDLILYLLSGLRVGSYVFK